MMMDFVEAVLDDRIRVVCESAALQEQLIALGARQESSAFLLTVPAEDALASALQTLQRLGLHFADAPAGWPPAAVFLRLREQGAVCGAIRTITWTAPGKVVLGLA